MRLIHHPGGWLFIYRRPINAAWSRAVYPSRDEAVEAAHQAGLAVSPLGLVSVTDCPACALTVAPRQTI